MKTQSGFTLIELMVTLAVGIVILAIGLPSIMTMVSSNQAAGYANDLVGAIRLARSEAVNRGGSVTICASNENLTDCSGNNWNNGWVVFVDVDSNSLLNSDSGDTILKVWAIPDDERAKLSFNNTPPNAIRFDSGGGNASGAPIQIAFQKSDCHANQARQITVSIMGRATLDHVACSSH